MAKRIIWGAGYVFIHRSNKTRIETCSQQYLIFFHSEFLYIDPIKQGLKPVLANFQCLHIPGFYT